jgi:RNA polymerase sigma-70 factor (ECF subfamily)
MQDFLDEIEEHIPSLRRYARALTHDRDKADDLVQDCLERAIRKKRLWRPTGPLRAWLFKVLLNIYRNDLRHRRSMPVQVPLAGIGSEPQAAENQHGRLALAETARAIGALPTEQREALLIVVLEGMSYREAADILGIPIGTLMSRIGRARATIKEMTGNNEPALRVAK